MKTVNRPARQVSRLVLHLLLILAFTLATFLITTPFTTERAFAATETQLIWQRLEELETLALNAGDNLDVASKTPKNYFTINNKGDVYNTSQCLLSNVLQKNTAIRSLCTKNKGGVPSFSACFKDTHWCYDYGGKTSINGYECYAFANFAAWYLGAKDSSSVLSYSKIAYDKAFTKASFVNAGWRVGDVVRISRYDSAKGKWLGHSVVLVHVHDNKITVLDANYWNSRYGYCRIMLHNITYNSAQKIAISRPKIYGANSNTYTIQYNANGGSGSMADTKVTYGVQHTLRANTFTRTGYTFKGWYGYRKSDGKWRYTDGTNSGWYAEGSQPSGYYKTLWEDQRTMGGKGSEVNGDTIICYAQWSANTYRLIGYHNLTGKNYLYGSAFSGNLNTGAWKSRDTSVSTVAVDTATTYGGYNSLKIVNTQAGASGKDLHIVTATQGNNAGNGFVGDQKEMILSFYAKASVSGTKIFFRWGYEPTANYRSVTLSTNWQKYTVRMDKLPTYGNVMNPYIDRAGTVWLAQMQLEDGTAATAFAPENGGSAETKNTYGKTYTLPPAPVRMGYTFTGWYTAATGGSQITAATPIKAGHFTVYAHWQKEEEPVDPVDPGDPDPGQPDVPVDPGDPEPVPIHMHKWGAWKKLNASQHQRVCSLDSSHVQKQDHRWDGGKVTKAATTRTAGVRTYTCTVCGATRTASIAKLKTNVTRLAGDNRYATAVKIADALKKQYGVSQFSSACIADGRNFPDALAGAYLAKVKKAPLLVTHPARFNETISYLQKNVKKGSTVYILGGTGSVPAEIQTLLQKAGFKWKRLGGANRYETNLLILKEAGVKKQEILVTDGTQYQDSLSASGTGRPILLVRGSELTASQTAYLKTLQAKKFWIVGNTSVIQAGIEKGLKKYGSTARINGATCYDRSVNIAKQFFPGKQSHLTLAPGENFPDALCGGPLAIAKGGPLILTTSEKKIYAKALAYAKNAGTIKVTVLGGQVWISDQAAKAILTE